MEQELKTKLDEMGRTWNEFTLKHKTLEEEIKNLGREDGLLKETMNAAAADVAKHYEELTTKFNDVATRLNRITTESGDPVEDAKERDAAIEFKRNVLMCKGALQPDQEIDTASAIAEYKGYTKLIGRVLRYGNDHHSLTPEDKKALSVGTAQDGGFFVRPVWSARIIQKIYESSPIRQLATIETIAGPELKYPIDNDEATFGWVGEMQARPVTNTPQVQEKSIIAHEMYAQPKATQTILEDAGIDVEAWLMGKVADKFARGEATAFVTGNGVAKPRGLLSYPDGTAWGQVERKASGTSAQFDPDTLVELVGSLKEPYHPGSRFITRRESVPMIMTLKDGDGRYIFQPIFSSGFNNAPLLGYPITFAADMPVAADGAMAMIFGDVKTAYTIVDRIGITMLRDPFSFKPFVAFYTRRRVGGDVLNFEAYKIYTLSA